MSLYADDTDTINALRSAYDSMAAGVNLRATYIIRKWTTDDLESAFAAPAPPTATVTEDGRYCKDGQFLRHTITSRLDPVLSRATDTAGRPVEAKITNDGRLSGSEGTVVVRGIPYDEVSSFDYVFMYRSGSTFIGDQANLQRRSEIEPNPRGDRCSRGEEMLSPVNPTGGCNTGLPGEPSPSPSPSKYIVTNLDDNRIRLVVTDSDVVQPFGEVSTTYATEWWTEPHVPVLERVSQTISYEATGEVTQIESGLSEFTDCGGYTVARRVITGVRNSHDNPWLITEWHSKDLGNSPSLPEDFQIEVSQSATVIGTEITPDQDGRRIFSIHNVPPFLGTEQVFAEELQHDDLQQPLQERNTQIIGWRSVVVLNAVLAMVAWYLIRSRRGNGT